MEKNVVTYARGLKEEVLARACEIYDAGLMSDLGNIRGFPNLMVFINQKPEFSLMVIKNPEIDHPLKDAVVYFGG